MATVIHDHEDYADRPEVIHEHYHGGGEGWSAGAIIGAVLGIIILAILLIYGLPLLRNALNRSNSSVPGTINVNLNAPNSGGNTGGTAPAPAAP